MKKICIFLFLSAFVFSSCTKNNIESGMVEVNGTKLYYEIAGSGDPVVLIHDWSFDLRCWDDQFVDFSRNYRVLRYDLRGFGKSSLPQKGQSYSHTDDLVELMNYLDIEKAHILGHSFGGKIATDFTLKFPEKVLSLFLPDAAMDVKGVPLSKELSDWIGNTWKAGREKGIDEAKCIWMNGSPLKPAFKIPIPQQKLKK